MKDSVSIHGFRSNERYRSINVIENIRLKGETVMRILLALIIFTSATAFATDSESYSCKAFVNQTPEHKDIAVSLALLSCENMSCTGDLKIHFKNVTIFSGSVSLKKNIVIIPNYSVTTIFENRDLNSPYGVFHFAREEFMDGRKDFIYGQIHDVNDNFEMVNFECNTIRNTL